MECVSGVTEVTLYYGVKTGEAKFISGEKTFSQNCFQYKFENDQAWKQADEKGEIWFRMNSGYITKDIFGLLPDKKFIAGNSILHAWKKDVSQDSSNKVLIWYRRLDSIPFNAGRTSWEMKYSNLNLWNPDEKTLRTLQPFTANDFEGKQLQQEINQSNTLLRWKWIAGIIVGVVVVLAFVFAEVRKRKT